MSPILVRPERVWPKLSSIQGIRANLVYIVSLLNVSFMYLGILILSALVSIKYFWGKQDLIFGNIDSNPKNLYPNALFTISNQKMIVIGYYHISIILIQKGSII